MYNLKERIGTRLRELRKIRGIRQNQLAEMIDLDPRSISRIEVGGNYPSFDSLSKICKILGCDINYFFYDDGEKTYKNILHKYIDTLSNDDIEVIIKMIKIIKNNKAI